MREEHAVQKIGVEPTLELRIRDPQLDGICGLFGKCERDDAGRIGLLLSDQPGYSERERA